MTGTLYLVSTPVGNLEDITYRAVRILSEVDIIACEDTRHSRILLDKFTINSELTSLHDFNKEKKTPELLEKLLNGKNIAYISDAGTPGISDPGFYLCRAAVDEGIEVISIPGAAAFLIALTSSALPTDNFIFNGFLPPKKGRQKKLIALKEIKSTHIFYESPYRIVRTLQDLLEFFGDCPAVVGRELTKKFEEFWRGTLAEILSVIDEKKIKGEFTILINNR